MSLGNGTILDSSGAISFGDENLSTTGTLGSGTITVQDGSSINLQEDITFTGATTVNQIKFPDNLADALSFKEGANAYLSFTSTDGSESVNIHKTIELSSNLSIRSQNELRFYDNGNYVGFEAPDLTADQIWKLPTVDATSSHDVLVSDSAGALSFYRPNIDWLSDVNIDGWITPYMNCLLAYNQDAGEWAAAIPEYDIRWKSYDIKWDFETATPPAPWAYGALNNGTVTTAWLAHHPGTVAVVTRADGDASNSGYYWVAANDEISINGLEQADFVFYTPGSLTDVRARLGFQDSITVVDPNDGIYLNLAGTTLNGICREGASETTTGTTYTVSIATWYRGRIIVNTAANSVKFRLYDVNGDQLWEQDITATIPTATDYVGFGLVAWITSDIKSTMSLRIDLADFICARGLTR